MDEIDSLLKFYIAAYKGAELRELYIQMKYIILHTHAHT